MNLSIHYTQTVLSTKMLLLDLSRSPLLAERSALQDAHQMRETGQNSKLYNVLASIMHYVCNFCNLRDKNKTSLHFSSPFTVTQAGDSFLPWILATQMQYFFLIKLRVLPTHLWEVFYERAYS